MKSKNRLWQKTAKFIIAFCFLALGAALYLGCGEDTLPPSSEPSPGTITISGAAV